MNPTTTPKPEAKHSPLPCPFCGRDADVSVGPEGVDAACSNFKCGMRGRWIPFEAWNARAESPIFAEMRDALEAAAATLEVISRETVSDDDAEEDGPSSAAIQAQDALPALTAILAKLKDR